MVDPAPRPPPRTIGNLERDFSVINDWFQNFYNDVIALIDGLTASTGTAQSAADQADTKAEAAELFGVSRPTFYQAEAAFDQAGLAGLLPRPRGPKSAHKLTPEVMSLIHDLHREGAPIQARALAQVVQQRLGVMVHPRSIERALARKKKL